VPPRRRRARQKDSLTYHPQHFIKIQRNEPMLASKQHLAALHELTHGQTVDLAITPFTKERAPVVVVVVVVAEAI
jgi:hypothetical protein